jgi:hypothetical protein
MKERLSPNFACLMQSVSLARFGHEGVMGYHRPVSEFNRGKKSEFYSRKCFTEEKAVAHLNGQETLDNLMAAE